MKILGQLIKVVTNSGEFSCDFLKLRKVRYDLKMIFDFSENSLVADIV